VTEDEAFIREIVGRPGDDLPRLVYADWLDERDDPRGTFLRAEVEWAMAKQMNGVFAFELNGLAEGLNQVWVARVSRPPLGVCADDVTITHRGPRVTPADLATAEAELGLCFPQELRAFLLNFNGGVPTPDDFDLGQHDANHVRQFTSLSQDEGPPTNLIDGTRHLWQQNPATRGWLLLSVGRYNRRTPWGRTRILISTSSPDVGAIYHLADWRSGEPLHDGQLLAKSFGRFLARLGTATNFLDRLR